MNDKRIVFLDYLRVIAIFMVMVVHCCEQFYFNGDGDFHIASAGDAFWVTFFDSAVRSCVPLFVMTSAYLLFPVTKPTAAFLPRRILRVFVPFAVWTVIYTIAWKGDWGMLAFNFPMMTGVALMAMSLFAIVRKFDFGGALHRFVIRPLSEASFGVYLLHMLVLVEVIARLRDDMTTPTTIVVGALATYLIASLVSLVIRRIPFVGKWICG